MRPGSLKHSTCTACTALDNPEAVQHRAASAKVSAHAHCRYEKYAAKPDAPADRPPTGADVFMDEYFYTMLQIKELSKARAVGRLHGASRYCALAMRQLAA